MATFQCLQSGNFVTFTLPYDIKTMMVHPEYKLVEEVPPQSQPRIGRPRKVVEDVDH